MVKFVTGIIIINYIADYAGLEGLMYNTEDQYEAEVYKRFNTLAHTCKQLGREDFLTHLFQATDKFSVYWYPIEHDGHIINAELSFWPVPYITYELCIVDVEMIDLIVFEEISKRNIWHGCKYFVMDSGFRKRYSDNMTKSLYYESTPGFFDFSDREDVTTVFFEDMEYLFKEAEQFSCFMQKSRFFTSNDVKWPKPNIEIDFAMQQSGVKRMKPEYFPIARYKGDLSLVSSDLFALETQKGYLYTDYSAL